jgi:hypothetical protein
VICFARHISVTVIAFAELAFFERAVRFLEPLIGHRDEAIRLRDAYPKTKSAQSQEPRLIA